jgi:hypothetical protein
LITEDQKYKRAIKIFKTCATLNTGCDVKKQHSQSEMRAIRIYHLSQLGEGMIKLLKQETPCLVTEVQGREVNVKISLQSQKRRGKILNQGIYQRSNISALLHRQ